MSECVTGRGIRAIDALAECRLITPLRFDLGMAAVDRGFN